MTSTQSGKPKRSRIIPLGIETGWIESRELTRERGGLPSNLDHDDVLVYSEEWRALFQCRYYPAWAKEVIVHPAKDGTFKRNGDVANLRKDEKGRIWTLPESYLPEFVIGREKVGLVVDPDAVEVTNERVVIHPKSIFVIAPFMQNDREYGIAEKATGIPVHMGVNSLRDVDPRQIRRLVRHGFQAVRPLVRGFVNNRREICADCFPNGCFSAGYVERESSQLRRQ